MGSAESQDAFPSCVALILTSPGLFMVSTVPFKSTVEFPSINSSDTGKPELALTFKSIGLAP